jgi:hypothetical protein
MLELLNKKVITQVKSLIGARNCQAAISNIMDKGRIIRELTENELAQTPSDLVITPSNAYWTVV